MSKTERSQYVNEEKRLERKIRKNQTKKRNGTKNQEIQKQLNQEKIDNIEDDESDN